MLAPAERIAFRAPCGLSREGLASRFAFTVSQGRIVAIEVVMEASRLAELALVVPTLDDGV